MQLREEHGVAYHRSFPGCQLIDWLLQNGEVESRRQGIDLCRALQEHGIVQHGEGCTRNGRHLSDPLPPNGLFRALTPTPVAKKHDFFDSGLLYQFCINFRRRRRLSELLNEGERDNGEGVSVSTHEDSHPDSPFVLRKSQPQQGNSAFNSGILGRKKNAVLIFLTGHLHQPPFALDIKLVAFSACSVLTFRSP